MEEVASESEDDSVVKSDTNEEVVNNNGLVDYSKLEEEHEDIEGLTDDRHFSSYS